MFGFWGFLIYNLREIGDGNGKTCVELTRNDPAASLVSPPPSQIPDSPLDMC